MLAAVLSLRLYLHLVHVRHIYTGGYLVHHLFVGVLIVVPAAFLLAFGTRHRVLARVILGICTGLILDEVVYLVATKASDADYVSLGFAGWLAASCVLVAVIFLLVLFALHRDET